MGKTTKMNKVVNVEAPNLVSLDQYKQEIEQLKTQAIGYHTIATQAANRLVQAESLLSPQLIRKPNFWNILFHFREVIMIIKEVLKIIQEFKQQYMTADTTKEATTNNATA